MDNDNDENEIVFNLRTEINRLRNQVTYLQEELASAEDYNMKQKEMYEREITRLENVIGSQY